MALGTDIERGVPNTGPNRFNLTSNTSNVPLSQVGMNSYSMYD